MDTNAVILRALEQVRPNAYVTIDSIRDACTSAQLSSAEKSGGLRSACADGYLTPVYHLLPGFSLDPVHVAVPSTHPAAKSRHVLVYRRTSKKVAKTVAGQGVSSRDEVEFKGTKTAPGGASTPLVQGPRPSDSTGGLPA